MLVGDIVYNDVMDIDCSFTVVRNRLEDDEEILLKHNADEYFKKPLSAVLDLEVDYITIHDNTLIIVVK